MSFNVKKFREKFFERLEQKTGWSKNEVKKLFDDVYFECLEEV